MILDLPSRSLCDTAAIVTAAEAIIARRSWCVIEVCADVPRQTWDPRLLLLLEDPDRVARAVQEWIRTTPGQDVRLGARRRQGLRPDPEAPTLLCHVA